MPRQLTPLTRPQRRLLARILDAAAEVNDVNHAPTRPTRPSLAMGEAPRSDHSGSQPLPRPAAFDAMETKAIVEPPAPPDPHLDALGHDPIPAPVGGPRHGAAFVAPRQLV